MWWPLSNKPPSIVYDLPWFRGPWSCSSVGGVGGDWAGHLCLTRLKYLTRPPQWLEFDVGFWLIDALLSLLIGVFL